ncbi:MAG: type II secretion system major pseudopilin GspG [Gammaproteobacteria bacterium]|nr:type II secretion system major pseudopilin GspG [Gammaproteobacteria bacterium]
MHVNSGSKNRRDRGFTLIEIMVVVVIIGLLAAIVAPNVISNVDTARVTRAKQDIRTIEVALNQFYLDNYRYPTNEEGLEVLIGRSQGFGNDNAKQYLPRLPIDPWDREYLYEYPGRRGGEFDVYTLGADGEEGGEEINADIGNWDLS